jgi:hypothetical protein
MGWVLRLVETGVEGSSRSVDVMAIDRPGDLSDIADLGLTPTPMQWSKAGAHLLLQTRTQTRTQTLDGTLPETFRKWYPAMAANDTQIPAAAA